MTVNASAVTCKYDYNGNDVTVAFSFPQYFGLSSYLDVYLVDGTTGVGVLQTEGIDYTVTGAGDAAGGTVTTTIAPGTGTRLSIVRDDPLQQNTTSPYSNSTFEAALDKIVRQIMKLWHSVGRSLKLRTTDIYGTGVYYYDALTTRISNVGYPLEANDAATVLWVGDTYEAVFLDLEAKQVEIEALAATPGPPGPAGAAGANGLDYTADAELNAIAGLVSAADRLPYFTGLGTASLATFTTAGRNLIDDADTTAQRVTLGLVIGTDVQAYDAELAAIAGLVSAADRLPYFTGLGAASLATFSVFMRTLVDDADAATARATLGVVIGTDVQAYDAELAAIAGLVSAADRLPYYTGLGTAALATFTTAGRNLIDDADATAQRVTLGLVIGTDVQAYDAELAAIAGLVSAADKLPYYTGVGTASLATFTAFARTMMDDADAATVRATIGLTTTDNPQFATIELGAATDTTLSRSAAGVMAVEGVVIPSISSTNTLTNKRVTKRVTTEASNATPTPNVDNADLHTITAQAAAAAFAAPGGTPTEGQPLMIRIKDNGTARALTWNAIYRTTGDISLPTTTVLSKTMYLGFVYNNTDTKWDLVAKVDNI